MPENLALLASIFLALAVGCFLVSLAGSLVDRHTRVRDSLSLKKHCRELAERERRTT